MSTALGSIEYGINNLKSKVLLIVGHTACGAVKAAKGDYSQISPAIKKELDTLNFNKDLEMGEAIIDNIKQQIKFALDHFADKIKKNQLVVVGMLYDFTGKYTDRAGSIKLLSVNGESVK